MIHFLFVVVVKVKYDVVEIFWVLELQVNSWAYALDSFALELLNVVSEFISTDPDFAEFSLFVKDFLARWVKLAEHEHFFFVMGDWLFMKPEVLVWD